MRELEIRDKAMEKLQRSREKKKLPTLASEISMDPLRVSCLEPAKCTGASSLVKPSSRHTSSRDTEEALTRNESPNSPFRPVSPKQSFVDRRYKLQTPLVPARSGSPEIDAAPLASVAAQPESSVISSSADHDRTGRSRASSTAKPDDSLGLTPPKEASIGLDTPSPAIYITQPSDPTRQGDDAVKPATRRNSDVFDDELMSVSP